MNLSESSIAHLEKRAFIRGMERAAEIAWNVAEGLEVEEASGAHDVRLKIEEEAHDLEEKLDEQENA